ncbi:MAG: AAA family ATPase [Pseudomonas sp.]
MSTTVNDHLVLIMGTSATGKSASLRDLEDQPGVMYLNCESGKKLPFPNKFMNLTVTDPLQVFEAFDKVASGDIKCHTIVIDSLTFLLDMYESKYIVGATNGQAAWGAFQQYFKNLMQEYVAASPANVVFTAHTLTSLNEGEMAMETKVPVKGALKNNGINLGAAA